MAIINKSNVIIPEVMEDLMQYEYEEALQIGKLAFHNYTLEGNAGDTVTIPYVGILGEAETVSEDGSLTPENTSDNKVTIEITRAGKAVEMTQSAINSAAYDLKDVKRTQLARSVAAKVDTDLATEMAKTTLEHTMTAGLTYQEVVKARALMGEEAFLVKPVLLLNSKTYADLAVTPEFIAGAVQLTDFGIEAAGMLVDMPVIVSDRVKDNEAYIVVPGSFVLAHKQEPTLYADIDALSEKNIMSMFVHYGVKLPNPARGVVKIKKQA